MWLDGPRIANGTPPNGAFGDLTATRDEALVSFKRALKTQDLLLKGTRATIEGTYLLTHLEAFFRNSKNVHECLSY